MTRANCWTSFVPVASFYRVPSLRPFESLVGLFHNERGRLYCSAVYVEKHSVIQVDGLYVALLCILRTSNGYHRFSKSA